MGHEFTDRFLPGEVLRRLREHAGMDQTTLSKRCGLPQPDISKRETGKTRIKPIEYLNWDRWLGLEPGEFEAQLNNLRRSADLEAKLGGAHDSAPDRELAVVQTVLGELGPIVAELSRLTQGPERQRYLDRLVAYGEALVDVARSNAEPRQR